MEITQEKIAEQEGITPPPQQDPEPTEKQLFLLKLKKETSMHRRYEMLMEYSVKYDLPKSIEYLKHINAAEQTSSNLRRYWEIAIRVIEGEEKPRIVDSDYETKPISVPLLSMWVSQGTAIYLETTNKDLIALNKKVKKEILRVTKLVPDKEKKEVTLIATDIKDKEYEIILKDMLVPALWFRFIDYPGTEKYAASKEMKVDYEKRMKKGMPVEKAEEKNPNGVPRIKITKGA